MGLLDNQVSIYNRTERDYYQAPSSEHGNYQFTSLNDIIDQFMIAYVGEDKLYLELGGLMLLFTHKELCRN